MGAGLGLDGGNVDLLDDRLVHFNLLLRPRVKCGSGQIWMKWFRIFNFEVFTGARRLFRDIDIEHERVIMLWKSPHPDLDCRPPGTN